VKNSTRNTLLVTVATAALVMGTGLAFAQDTKENRETPGTTAHGPKAPGGKMDQHPDSMRQKSPAPTAQAPMKEEKPAVNAQAPAVSKSETKGQKSTTSESPNPRTAPTAAKDEAKPAAPAALSTEQHAKIRDTLQGGKAERLTNVQFSTSIGEAVPGTVHLYVLPVSVLEYAPQYRDYEYILVGDEILIVDPRTLRIVAVIAA
jgi:hypothetical protein